MTKPDWSSIKRDYVETTWTLADVEAKWGVRRGTLSARCTRENWHEQKQQFAAILEQRRRSETIAKLSAEQALFESAVIKIAKGQLALIARQLQDEGADAGKVLKLASALKTLQGIGSTAFGGVATADPGTASQPSRRASSPRTQTK